MQAYIKHYTSLFDNVQKLPTNARGLDKCSKSSTFTRNIFKLTTQQLTIVTQTVNQIQLTRHSTAVSFNRQRCYKINSLRYKVSYSYWNTVENISMERSWNRKTLVVDHTLTKISNSTSI